MDAEDVTLEDKCENLMNIVVETRKQFGKLCRDYDHKSNLVQNNIQSLQLDTISNYNFKPKNPVICSLEDSTSDIEAFIKEVTESRKQIENIQKKLQDTREIVVQINNDQLNRRVKEPLNAQILLQRAKNKK